MVDYEQQLQNLIGADAWLIQILETARTAELPNWYIGAGIIRDLVWDHLHQNSERTPPNDVDVAFFDPDDLTEGRDEAATAVLHSILPNIPWEATNQAAVHTWHERVFGYAIDPYQSTEEGIASWPETATSMGVRLMPDDSLHVYAPCGLEDLFTLKLRRNPTKVTLEEYRQRYVKKKMKQKWPLVGFIDG